MKQDLPPDRGAVDQDEFAVQAPWTEFGVADAHDMHAGAAGRAEPAPAVMEPVKRPPQRSAWRAERVVAADLVVNGEGRVSIGVQN